MIFVLEVEDFDDNDNDDDNDQDDCRDKDFVISEYVSVHIVRYQKIVLY